MTRHSGSVGFRQQTAAITCQDTKQSALTTRTLFILFLFSMTLWHIFGTCCSALCFYPLQLQLSTLWHPLRHPHSLYFYTRSSAHHRTTPTPSSSNVHQPTTPNPTTRQHTFTNSSQHYDAVKHFKSRNRLYDAASTQWTRKESSGWTQCSSIFTFISLYTFTVFFSPSTHRMLPRALFLHLPDAATSLLYYDVTTCSDYLSSPAFPILPLSLIISPLLSRS